MTKLKSIADLLNSTDNSQEVYISDQKERQRRKSLGYITSGAQGFDFIHLLKAWNKLWEIY